MPTEYTPTKVLLHDPDTPEIVNPKSLYPITALTAITESVASGSPYIVSSGTTKIKYQYLGIMDNQGKVVTTYLPITFTAGGAIDNTSLDIFTTEGDRQVIKSELLPSFVDDVVSVPVITDINAATGDLVIVATTVDNVTTYAFWKKSGNTYVQGGGETGKIYIDNTDGSMYRCVTGTTVAGTVAAKISDNPYAVASTKTNGVYLDTTGGELKAKADFAATDGWGTVKINGAATNNVKLTVTADGIIAASAGLANAATVGVVYAVTTEAQATALTDVYGETYVVPNVKYIENVLSGYIVPVGKASYEEFGTVKITSNGNLDCTSGVLTLASAGESTNGVVKIVNTINTATTANDAKAVTQSGIVTYVSGQLGFYQKSLTEGDGIQITSNGGVTTIAARVTSPIAIYTSDGHGYISATSATATNMGVVVVTSDAAYISAGTNAIDGKPITVMPGAVSSYVADKIASSAYTLPIATDSVRGGFRTSSASTALGMTTATGDATVDVLQVKTTGPVFIDNTNNANALNVSSASTTAGGIVQVVTTSAAIEDTNSASAVPVASAVSAYVSARIAASAYTLPVANANSIGGIRTSASATALGLTAATDATTSEVLAVQTMGPVYIDTTSNALNVSSASTTAGGIVQIVTTSAGIDNVDSASAVPVASAISAYVAAKMGIQSAAGYAATVSATEPALGGIRVVSSGGLCITTAGTSAGNLYLDSATAGHIGGVKLATENTGINAATNAVISANTALPIHINASNQIAVSAATTESAGVVLVKATSATVVAAESVASAVPNCAGLIDYVTSYTAATYQPSITDGAALYWGTGANSNTLNVSVVYPLNINADAVNIADAVAETGATLTSAAHGAVWARNTIREAATIDAEAGNQKLSTVPTEKAVRTLVDALPYITYTTVTD